MLGRFLELSVETADIRASVEFYERLGFSQCVTSDTWPHPYGALTDGRLVIGLHQYRFPSPSITFVHDGIARHLATIEAMGFEIAFRRTGDDMFNEFGFRDSTGHMVTVLEARTFSPPDRGRDCPSSCGDFAEYSLPARDFTAARAQWETFGFVAVTEECAANDTVPWRRLPLTSDRLNLAFHAPRFFERPLLVFTAENPADRRARLTALDVPFSTDLPAALDPGHYALIESPEGLAILLAPG